MLSLLCACVCAYVQLNVFVYTVKLKQAWKEKKVALQGSVCATKPKS